MAVASAGPLCKSAPRSRQITIPAPHHSVFLQAGCPSCRPTNSVEALKAHTIHTTHTKWRRKKVQRCTAISITLCYILNVFNASAVHFCSTRLHYSFNLNSAATALHMGKHVCAEPPPSVHNKTLPAFAAARRPQPQRPCSYRSISPARGALSCKRRCWSRSTGQTEGQADGHPTVTQCHGVSLGRF